MTKPLLCAIAAIAIFGCAFFASFWAATYSADRLKAGAIICADRGSMYEAIKAGDDPEWREAIPDCLVTGHTVKVKAINCNIWSCLIRYFDVRTGVGYVKRADLFKS